MGISLSHMPLGYRQTVRLIPSLGDLSEERRDEICDALAEPLRERGVDVASVRIYKVVASVRPNAPPPTRTLKYECGGRAT